MCAKIIKEREKNNEYHEISSLLFPHVRFLSKNYIAYNINKNPSVKMSASFSLQTIATGISRIHNSVTSVFQTRIGLTYRWLESFGRCNTCRPTTNDNHMHELGACSHHWTRHIVIQSPRWRISCDTGVVLGEIMTWMEGSYP